MELIYKFPNDPCNLLGIGITHGLRNKTEKSVSAQSNGFSKGKVRKDRQQYLANCLHVSYISTYLLQKFARFQLLVKFIFSKKATKIDEIFTVDLTLTEGIRQFWGGCIGECGHHSSELGSNTFLLALHIGRYCPSIPQNNDSIDRYILPRTTAFPQ